MRDVRVRKSTLFWEWWSYEDDWPKMMGWALTRKRAIRGGTRYFQRKDREAEQEAKDRVERAKMRYERIPYSG
jgi:hypothetical protein